MNKKYIFWAIVIICSVLLIVSVVRGDTDNTKVYDSENEIIEVFDSSNVSLATFQLITPRENIVPRGYNLVAEIKVSNSQNTNELFMK